MNSGLLPLIRWNQWRRFECAMSRLEQQPSRDTDGDGREADRQDYEGGSLLDFHEVQFNFGLVVHFFPFL